MALTDRIIIGPGGDTCDPADIDPRLQTILENKDEESALWGESWSIIDGTLVISFEGQEPGWLELLKSMRDDDGNTDAAVRAPAEVSC